LTALLALPLNDTKKTPRPYHDEARTVPIWLEPTALVPANFRSSARISQRFSNFTGPPPMFAFGDMRAQLCLGV